MRVDGATAAVSFLAACLSEETLLGKRPENTASLTIGKGVGYNGAPMDSLSPLRLAQGQIPSLKDDLQFLKGVGPALASALAKIGLRTAGDLLRHFPRRWEDRTRFRSAADLVPGETTSILGVIIGVTTKYPRPKMAITEVLLDSNGEALRLTWFNQPYLEKTFQRLQAARKPIVVYGTARRTGFSFEMPSPEWEEVSEESDPLGVNRIVPIYPLTEGVGQKRMRRLLDTVLQTHLPLLQETLPASVVLEHRLLGVETAYRNLHFPDSNEYLKAARHRIVFDEFFTLQCLLALRRRANSHLAAGIPMQISLSTLNQKLADIVPFTLTGAQKRAISEIAEDLSSGQAMNRLVQGDVGSGKTMVALAAMLMAVQNGYQAALMAPTEILAQQHCLVLRRLLEPIGLTVELAIGSQGAKEKRDVRERILGGQSMLAVGTHALIQEGVEFGRLGLVVIDEQHRFGVLQRQALAKKGTRPHVLVMTATPIPRTLTMTLYGDLDVSVLNELPPGRKEITTHWKTQAKRNEVYVSAHRLLAQGRQVYVVCPLVEESEKLQAKSATQLAEHIAENVFPQYRVGLLHGQMKSEEKDEVMRQFKAHELDILVSTTVIEVGIDVPNASVIIIEDAERFGLAQLHQLRGRVGRGEHASFCILIAEPKTEEGRARMEVMVETRDGFRIAEEDLRLRGPGEFFGTRQSGMPELILADILQDFDVLTETREAAFRLIEDDPELRRPEHRALRQRLAETEVGFELVSTA